MSCGVGTAMNHTAGTGDCGFTLVEVLVALLLLSIGLLGLAGLQTRSLHSNGDALARSQASMIAYNILDYLRATTNPLQPNYTRYQSSQTFSCSSDGLPWQSALCNPPGYSAQIHVANGSDFAIVVSWTDSSGLSSPKTYSVTVDTRL